MAAIQSNTTKASISELIHIGLVSLTHWRRIVEFLLKVSQDSSAKSKSTHSFPPTPSYSTKRLKQVTSAVFIDSVVP